MKEMNLTSIYRTVLTLMGTVIFSFLIASPLAAQTRRPARVQTSKIQITRMGYEPMSITLKRGVTARITFLRTTDDTCATEVVFPDYGIRRELPLNQAVAISLTPKTAGEFSFTCGMNMHRGKLIVR